MVAAWINIGLWSGIFLIGYVFLFILGSGWLALRGPEEAWAYGAGLLVLVPYVAQVVGRVRQPLFRYEKEVREAKLVGLWPSRELPDAIREIGRALDACSKDDELLLAGISLHDFFHETGHYYQHIKRLLDGGGKLRVALLDPLSEAALQRADSEEGGRQTCYSDSTLFRDIMESLRTLKETCGEKPRQIRASLFRQPCRWWMVKAGRRVFVADYRLAPPKPREGRDLSGEVAALVEYEDADESRYVKDFEELFNEYQWNGVDEVLRAVSGQGLADAQGRRRPGRKGFGIDESEWIERNYEGLRKEYAGAWIGVSAEGDDIQVVATGDSLDSVIEATRHRGEARPFVVRVRGLGEE